MRASFIFLAASLALSTTVSAQANETTEWPSPPSRLELSTPYGDLHVSSSEYVYESRLMFNNHEVEPQIKGLLNIPYAYSSPKFQIALVSIDTGEQTCPVSYIWVTLNENGYTTTQPFGSCSDKIRVSTEGATFSVHTPNPDDADKTDHYIYDGKSLTYKKPASSK